MPHLKLRERILLPRVRRRGPAVPQPAADGSAAGTVLLPFGRYFAARADMLTRDRFKTVVPIDDISPFTGVGDPDPEMQHFAQSERVNERVRTDVRKDLAVRLANADADFLVVDNSTALQLHREVNGRLYTVVPGEKTDLMDSLWNADAEQARTRAFKVSRDGLTDDLRTTYASFVRACLDTFDPTRIVLVTSHCPRFWIAEDGSIAPTDVDRHDARFLAALDTYFIEQTGCQVAGGTQAHFPSAAKWQTFDHRLRRTIEEDLLELCTPALGSDASDPLGDVPTYGGPPETGAADHVVGRFREGRPVDSNWLERYFVAGGASYDDLLALAYLGQREADGHDELVRRCVHHAVADAGSHPLAVTRRGFDRSLDALRGVRWWSLRSLPGRLPGRRSCSLRLARGELWSPQITVPCGTVVFRFLGDGSVQRVPLSRVAVSEAGAVVEGRLPVTPHNLSDVLASWPVYLERGRRGITAALRVLVPTMDELVATCSWIDWSKVLDNERIVITADPGAGPIRPPRAKTDLSFIFDSSTRIGTVGGGLMDQVTHVALFDSLCRTHGLDYYLDDLRYTWWRSHNGFEASRLAPDLERRRITRRVSQALIDSFREEVMRTRLPWVYNQSRAWYDLGLREATVVTLDYFNSRRLMEIGPAFPVHLYLHEEELGGLIREPPSPICFYTTQQRIPVERESAVPIRRVFSYHHLVASGLEPDVARTAELLRSAPHVALHVRRGDYLGAHFDTAGWHSEQSHYIEAIRYLIDSELGTSNFDVAVFSDDLEFVRTHASDFGLDRVQGEVRFIRGNSHFKSIFDSYLMSLCPVIVGSVGFFAATTSLLADSPSTFIRARPDAVRVEWRR